MIDQELINNNNELIAKYDDAEILIKSLNESVLLIQLEKTNANYKAVIEANADLYAENALLKSQANEIYEMLKHLVDHDCISDCSLHKECITLLAKCTEE